MNSFENNEKKFFFKGMNIHLKKGILVFSLKIILVFWQETSKISNLKFVVIFQKCRRSEGLGIIKYKN